MAQEDVIKTNVSPRRAMSAPKRAYLVAYNALSALLWSVVLGRTVATLAANGLETGPALVYPAVGEWTKWTQTLAGLEIVHSVLGMRCNPSHCSPCQPPLLNLNLYNPPIWVRVEGVGKQSEPELS